MNQSDPNNPQPPQASNRINSQKAPEPALGLPVDQATSILPADLLQGGEIIIMILKPSPLYIILWCFGQILGLLVTAWIANYVHDYFDLDIFYPRTLWMVVGTVVAVRLIYQFFDWLSRTYILTDRRVISMQGIMRIRIFQCTLKQVQHTDMLFSIRERCFGLGTIVISTAGTGGSESFWLMLRRPMAVHRKILQVLNRYGKQ